MGIVFYDLLSFFLALLLLPISIAVNSRLFNQLEALAGRRRYNLLRVLGLWLLLFTGAFAALRVVYHWDNVTVYAAGYSEARFQQVAAGMNEARVTQLLGKPLVRWRYDDPARRAQVEVSDYTKSLWKGDYEIRQVRFKSGRVLETVHYYYYD